jgi:ring-1,2-phenylacetyl-CoA epoxidase subunit PaaD
VNAAGNSVVRQTQRVAQAWKCLAAVLDPEIPVLSIVDLGIVRHVRMDEGGDLRVGLTPTYSGCPATDVIRDDVRRALESAGFAGAIVEEVLAPAWSSDDVTPAGHMKLAAFGIAPPGRAVASPRRLWHSTPVSCPRCASADTEQISAFGSTPCKSHHRCRACAEPFDSFKCL